MRNCYLNLKINGMQRHLRGRSVDFNPEEEQAKKQAKTEQRRKKMWVANGYISSSIIATKWVEDAAAAENEEPDDASAPSSSSSSSSAPTQWKCALCTFVNPIENNKCEMCDGERTAGSEVKGKEKDEVPTRIRAH
jgi:hypothetical protein